MKLVRLMALTGLLTLFTTGCTVSTESPDQLIKEKPIYNESKKEIYDGVEQLLLWNSELLLPGNIDEVGSINEVDLNGNGLEELVVFEKKENVNEDITEVGFMVLAQEGPTTYAEKGTMLIEGDTIEYANFCDLNSDGNLEIVLLVKDDEKTFMHIYSLQDDEIKLVSKLNPTWIPNRYDLVDMKVKIDYINEDDNLDILVLNHNPKENKAYMSLIKFEETLEVIDWIEIEDVRNINNAYITIGEIAKNQNGIVLDIPIVKNNNYITQLLYVEDDSIKKVFEDDRIIEKPYYIPIEDVDNDGIIDIPIGKGSSNVYRLNSSSNVSWYQWNGKYGEEAGLVFTSQIYYNYKYNYKLLIPNSLVDRFYIEEEYNGENVSFKFFYYDIEYTPEHIFTITAVKKNISEDNKSINTQGIISIGETYDYTFNLYSNNAEKLQELNVSIEALIEYFSLIY